MMPSTSAPRCVLRPEEFPLGTPESRAAARALLTARDELRNRIQQTITVHIITVGGTDKPPRCERKLSETGLLTEFVYYSHPAWSDEQLRNFINGHPILRPFPAGER